MLGPSIPENPPSLTTEPTQRMIPYTDVATVSLKPGDRITGVNTPQKLDIFGDLLSKKLSGRSLKASQVGTAASPSGRKVLSDYFEDDAKSKKYFGPVVNFEIIVLPPEPLKESFNSLSFYIKGHMHSAGKEIGSPERVNTLFVKPNGFSSLSSRVLDKEEMRKVLEKAPSSDFFKTLLNFFPGGLESLSK